MSTHRRSYIAPADGAAPPHRRTDTDAVDLELRDPLCSSAVQLLVDALQPPRGVRLRAGGGSARRRPAGGTRPQPAAVRQGPVPGPACREPVAAAAPAARPVVPGAYVTAKAAGVFYRASDPGAPPFVTEGDDVFAGQRIGIIVAMRTVFPVDASCAGTLTEVLVPDAAAVEYGDRLFAVASPREG